MKKVLIHLKRSFKLVILVFLATFLIAGAVAFFYKPIYSVTINGEAVGYSANKSALQLKINEYLENGEEGSTNVAFVQTENMPEYRLCLLKRGIVANDDEIFEKIKESGTTYYKYYAISEDGEEKQYVADFATAEEIVNELKAKESTNIDQISIIEKYETELQEFATKDSAVEALYIKPEPVVVVASKKKRFKS